MAFVQFGQDDDSIISALQQKFAQLIKDIPPYQLDALIKEAQSKNPMLGKDLTPEEAKAMTDKLTPDVVADAFQTIASIPKS